MPTYDYECTECGKVFELVQPITEPARRRLRKGDPKPCKCDAPVSRHIGTGGGILFKGSGFYQTDYRSEDYRKRAKSDATPPVAPVKSDGDKKSSSSETNKSAGAKTGKTEKA